VPWRDIPSTCTPLFLKSPLSVGRQALLFLILTAARSGEVRGATWDEIDFRNRVWTIPADRMKAGKPHRVPLSDQATAVLQSRLPFRKDSNWVFSNTGRSPISDMTLTKVLRDNKILSDTPGRTATAHGFRSSFRDWASEHQVSRDLAERALAHTIHNATEAAYHRTDLLEQRRDVMQRWANYTFPSI
jgi:integrase